MENKNTIVAIVLMLLVWVGFSLLFPQHAPQQQVPKPVAEKAAPAAPVATSLPAARAPEAEVPKMPVPAPSAAIKAQEVVVETPLYRAVFSNVGGSLKAFSLKKFHQSTDPTSPFVSLVSPTDGMTLLTSGSEGLGISSDTTYQVEGGTKLDLQAGEKGSIKFIGRAASGVVIEKIYSFQGDGYAFNLGVKIYNPGSTALGGDLLLTLSHPWNAEHAGSRYNYVGPTSLVGEKVKTAKVKDLEETPQVFGKETVWSGFETKYFMNIAVPLQDSSDKVTVAKTNSSIENQFQSPKLSLAGGSSRELSYLLYFGPRDLDILKKLDHQLAKAIDFGFFSIIAVPLLHVLKFFYSYVGNYGIAIILLTVIIKLIFWPLTQKSYGSMKAMQKLQPEMQKIREKYKNDKERLNREMTELYKTHRVNPLGGCLPMLIQIPVFFALYKVLLGSIELRHAYFGLWLTDLSAKDPYYITPIIMGVTKFVQQRMTPSSMDPTQAKLFLLMPVIFTFLFLNFPSGLVIYWLVNNLLTILQQYFINRKPATT